ncbi:MAG: hypothetical protein PQ964_00045 [Methanobacteriaceae archaeon]|jgi:hypothetical protein
MKIVDKVAISVIGAKVEGKSRYINLMNIKSNYYQNVILPNLGV